MKELTQQDFIRAAGKLKCEVAAIKAVASVESAGHGFYSDGFPVILFERHLFRRFTQGRYNRSHPHLSGPAGNYGAAGANQRRKFNEAFALNAEAAMKACSWGKFQILGMNYAVCGFASVGAFVDAMKESEGRHLDAFVEFVIGNNLARHLRTLNWAAFASGYNGKGYRKNNYDVKMANAYRKFSKSAAAEPGPVSTTDGLPIESTDSNGTNSAGVTQADPADISTTPPPNIVEQTIVTDEDGTVTATTTTASDSVKVTAPEPYQGVGFISVIKKDFAAIGAGNLTFQGLSEWATSASGWPEWVTAIITKVALVVIGLSVLWLIYRVVHYAADSLKKNAKLQMEVSANTSKDHFSIEWE